MIALLFALLIAITNPFECVPELGLSHIEARSIWVGYENGGWDVPEDMDDLEYMRPIREDSFEIWLRYRVDTNEYYVFVYAWKVTSQENAHPCGWGAITPEQFDEIMERVNEGQE